MKGRHALSRAAAVVTLLVAVAISQSCTDGLPPTRPAPLPSIATASSDTKHVEAFLYDCTLTTWSTGEWVLDCAVGNDGGSWTPPPAQTPGTGGSFPPASGGGGAGSGGLEDIGVEGDPTQVCDAPDAESVAVQPLDEGITVASYFATDDQVGGPHLSESSAELLCAMQACYREATAGEGLQVLAAAKNSGEWIYTQGGYQGGQEVPKDINSNVGDCTDFVWKASRTALLGTWVHSYANHLATGSFVGKNKLSPSSLGAHGFVEVSYENARAGDIVVRGGHAGVYEGNSTDPSHVMGYANNGAPATPQRDNHDGLTKDFDFGSVPGYEPHFFRQLVETPCP